MSDITFLRERNRPQFCLYMVFILCNRTELVIKIVNLHMTKPMNKGIYLKTSLTTRLTMSKCR